METFEIIQPSVTLSSYIKYYWILEADYESGNFQRVIPSGNPQLHFYRGASVLLRDGSIHDNAILCGQATTYTDLTLTGRIKIITVVFHPHGAKAFFNMPVSELTNRITAVDNCDDKALKELEKRITDTENDAMCIQLIEQFFIRRMISLKEYNYNRMCAIIHKINRHKGEVHISELAESVYLSYKQFQRIFTEHTGTTPKDFLRIIRFQKALFTLQYNPQITFPQLACECGYYDQSHLIHEFKTFTGYTPARYMEMGTLCSDYFS